MSDYISREAVRLIESDSEAYAEAWNASYEEGFCDAINAVLELPAADVVTWEQLKKAWAIATAIDSVPVVRCKDCVYWASGANEDESWEYCYWFESEIDGNEFCSYGERKDGADNA